MGEITISPNEHLHTGQLVTASYTLKNGYTVDGSATGTHTFTVPDGTFNPLGLVDVDGDDLLARDRAALEFEAPHTVKYPDIAEATVTVSAVTNGANQDITLTYAAKDGFRVTHTTQT